MSEEPHVHGPGCTDALVVGPFNSEPVLVVVVTKNDLQTGSAYVEARMPADVVPKFLRGLADKVERQNRAALS